MGNVNSLKTCSTHSKLLRNNIINCWGSNQKVRNSPSKLLGFSGSVAFVGFGIHQTLSNADPVKKKNVWKFEQGLLENGSRLFQQSLLRITSERFSLGIQKRKEKGASFFNRIKLFSLFTPVSCSGEDVICECCYNEKSSTRRAQTPPQEALEKCGCDCEECKATCWKAIDNNLNVSNVEGEGSIGSTAATAKNTSSNGNTNISNKSCGNSGSQSNSCQASDIDIDIDALSAQLGGLKQVGFVVESDLSHCYLIRQASQLTVDSVTRILTEAAATYQDYHAEYRRILDMMMDAMEESRSACGAELEVAECKIILIRAKVDEMKKRIQEVDMFLGSLEKLANASAETAFMAHAEYASIAMSERLHSLSLEVKRLREETKEKEKNMLELQSLIIVESGKSLR